MELLINNPAFLRRLIRRRKETGADRFDEVWEGVYIVSPLANEEHQHVSGKIYIALDSALPGLGLVLPGLNVSDRLDDWRQNYRCPDVAVYLNGSTSLQRGSHRVGGPDFAVEVVSRYDRSRQKLEFFAKVGTRELLIVDRDPWSLELYRLIEGDMHLIGTSTLERPDVVASAVMPLTFQLVPGDPRPRIAIAHTDGVQAWSA